MTIFNDTLAQGIGIAPAGSQYAIKSVSVAETFRAIYLLNCSRARFALASDGIGSHDVATPARGQVVREQLRIALAQTDNYKFHLIAIDGAGIAHALTPGRAVTLTGGVGIALTQLAQLSLKVVEELGLAPAMLPALKYRKTVSETLTVASALARFLGGDVVDAIHIEPLMLSTTTKPGLIEEEFGVADDPNPRLILRVTATDEVGIDAVDALTMLFSPSIVEGIELAAAYLSPGNSVVTWAMNTRTGAVTEYQNYAFNSFARVGDKYIGASETGLYELLGDDDDGTDIIADIKSGFAQWAGSAQLTMFKGIYLGLRGEGDFVLKLITGDDKTYVYAVNAQNQQTTKVVTGKGLRARYWAFELISTGQDFDLDTIEFVPLIAVRRV